MPYRNLYLIRHGQYQSGTARGEDFGLTDLGRKQAGFVADEFRNLVIHAIRCSTLRRAIETAQVITTGLGLPQDTIQADDTLREAIPNIPAHFAEQIAQFLPHFTPEQAESERQRANSGFERYFRPLEGHEFPPDGSHRNEIIVCHGNLIQYYTCLALGAGADRWLNLETYHCGITQVQVGASGMMKVIAFNNYSHVPLDCRTHN